MYDCICNFSSINDCYSFLLAFSHDLIFSLSSLTDDIKTDSDL